MFIARVTGSLVSTQKVSSFVGHKLMVVEPFRLDAETRKQLVTTGRTFIAIDLIGAGVDDFVLITQGSSARMTPQTKELPVDTVIIGMVDQVHVDESRVYDRQSNSDTE